MQRQVAGVLLSAVVLAAGLLPVSSGCARRAASVDGAAGAAGRVQAATRPVKPAEAKPAGVRRAVAADGQPLFDGRRGGGAFPYAGSVFPASLADVAAGMEQAYAQRLIPPEDGRRAVSAGDGGLTVDVSGWRVRPEYEPVQFDRRGEEQAVWRTARVQYTAEPLHYETGSVSVRLWAEEAELHGLREKGRAAVVLAGAKRGELRFSADREDLSRVFTAGARRGAGRAGVRVEQLTLEVDAPASNVLTSSVAMSGSWLLLPMRLWITATVVVDEDHMARFEPFVVRGEGPAGEFLAPFISRALKRMEGRRNPLMAFRDGKTTATGFHASCGERLEVTIAFGQPESGENDAAGETAGSSPSVGAGKTAKPAEGTPTRRRWPTGRGR